MRIRLLCLTLLCAILLGAPNTVTKPMPRTTTTLPVITQERVDGWLSTWSSRLRLQDWRIEAKIVRSTELKPDTLGHIKWDSDKKTALITLLDPLDYDLPATRIEEDMEMTVLHELIHLHLSVLPRDKSTRQAEEQVVNRIASALMDLDRRGR
jgi:hypothetical protein